MLIIKVKNNSNNNIYEKEFNFEEIYEINKKYKECKDKDELIEFVYYDFFKSKEIEIKRDYDFIIINNKEINREIKLERITFNEDEIFNDIFNKLSSLIFIFLIVIIIMKFKDKKLENQVNRFTQSGQNLRSNLKNNLDKIEHIIKDNKK